MGYLKEVLEQSYKDVYSIKGKTQADVTYGMYRNQFERIVGQIAIWKTQQNPNIKQPQLVLIEKTYEHHVLLKKETFNLEGEKGYLYFSVNYASVLCGMDTIELLEW
ncbi:hypothetical protein [Bacillus paranthracis]|uniref:hypothetical protein n=1 Tax=Bacillus paranthracis TaxID=2026186 RepID=UPI0021F94035|nr:hypothetical protein [Bacillus paranthracis]UXR28919.1 hypothetical protein [Bacillus phage Nachito]